MNNVKIDVERDDIFEVVSSPWLRENGRRNQENEYQQTLGSISTERKEARKDTVMSKTLKASGDDIWKNRVDKVVRVVVPLEETYSPFLEFVC